MVLDDENLQQRYFCDENGVFAWNIFVSPETFQNWNLPDERYSRLWVKCKDKADKAEFERFWYRTVTDGQVMKSYIAQDILDEIELAILYDTQIGVYIDRCGEDWLKLSQIRKSIRSFIPKKYISTGLSANVIGKFRELYLDGYDLSYFDKYL